MKKTIKRTLAILLAALMALSAGIAASAAAPPEKEKQPAAVRLEDAGAAQAAVFQATTLAVTTPPTYTSFVLETEKNPDLSGLVVQLTDGAFSKSIAYNSLGANDDIWCSWYNWDTDTVTDMKIGPCILFLYAETYDTATSTWYAAMVPYTFTATSLLPPMMAGATALTAGAAPVTAALTPILPLAAFKFTPATSGWYNFYSTDSAVVDPFGYLYSDVPQVLKFNDDSNNGLNFSISYNLTAGQTYYLGASSWLGNEAGTYKVGVRTVGTLDKFLRVSSVTVNYRDWMPYLGSLFNADLPWDVWQDLTCSDDILNFGVAWERGTTNVTITAPDGSSVTVKVTVKYSFLQWLYVIFLGGFAWIKYAPLGSVGFGYMIRSIINRLSY